VFEKLKSVLVCHLSAFSLALFLFIWIVAWTLKAVKGYNFDMNELTELYKWLLVQFAVESGLNTEIPFLKQLKGGKTNETSNTSGTEGTRFTGQE
jgi:hypothetical protein